MAEKTDQPLPAPRDPDRTPPLRDDVVYPELAPLEADLRGLGLGIHRITDLEDWPDASEYDRSVPVLLDHLDRPYPDHCLWLIAALLARRSRAVTRAWPDLVRHFRAAGKLRAPVARPATDLLRDALANALAKAYSNDRFDAMTDLIRDPANGPSRYLLVSAFRRRTSSPEVRAFLESLLDDPEIAPELRGWGIEPPDANHL